MSGIHRSGDAPPEKDRPRAGNAGPIGGLKNIGDNPGRTREAGETQALLVADKNPPVAGTSSASPAIAHLHQIIVAVFADARARGFAESSLDSLSERAAAIASGTPPEEYRRKCAWARGVREVDWWHGYPPPGRSYKDRFHLASMILIVAKAVVAQGLTSRDVEKLLYTALAEAVERAVRDV